MPEIFFEIDEGISNAARVEQLLDSEEFALEKLDQETEAGQD